MPIKKYVRWRPTELDGEDLFTNIFDLGGIRPPRKGRGGKALPDGLYDGYREACLDGEVKLLRWNRTGLAPDDLVASLNRNFGWDFQSVSELYDAIQRVQEERRKLRYAFAEMRAA